MPSATFLVHINVPDVSPLALAAEASDVQADLIQAGHDVESVTNWQRPSQVVAPVSSQFNTSGAAAAFGPPPPTL